MQDDLTLGERIAFHRRRRELSQREFAAEIGRSESWVSQVERGARSIDRLSVLQTLADVLGVPLAELRAEAAPQPRERTSDVQELRLVLTGHPALEIVLSEAEPEQPEPDIEQLAKVTSRMWPLLHESRYDELEPLLAGLIPDLEQAARLAKPNSIARAYDLLSQAYQAAASMLARLAESDAAWIAADRAVRAAEQTTQPLAVIASLFRMTHAFLGLRQLEEAYHVAGGATTALRPKIERADAESELLSLYGAMNLTLAVITARDGDRAAARQHLQEARTTAERLGEDRNDYGTEFGPTNVAIHAISVAVDLGDAGEAVDLAKA